MSITIKTNDDKQPIGMEHAHYRHMALTGPGEKFLSSFKNIISVTIKTSDDNHAIGTEYVRYDIEETLRNYIPYLTARLFSSLGEGYRHIAPHGAG